MKNRPRPRVPEKVQIAVALRQIGRLRVPVTVEQFQNETQPAYLERLLRALAIILDCPRSELRLDHDPPLRARAYNPRVKNVAARYTPNANDPAHLLYRPHSAEFEGSHHIKTNVRGDHGQFPDRILIKRERRRENPKKKRGTFPRGRSKIQSRPFQKGHRTFRVRRIL